MTKKRKIGKIRAGRNEGRIPERGAALFADPQDIAMKKYIRRLRLGLVKPDEKPPV